MKEQICQFCQASNELTFTLRPGNTEPITIRCRRCKRLLKVPAAAVPPAAKPPKQ